MLEPVIAPAPAALALGHYDLLELQTSLANACQRTYVELKLGIDVARDALRWREQRLSAGHYDRARNALVLGRLLVQAGRALEAIAVLEPYVPSYRESDRRIRPGILENHLALAAALAASQRRAELSGVLDALQREVEATAAEREQQRTAALQSIEAARAALAR